MTPKEKQRQLIIEIMKADEESGLYTTRKQTAVDWFYQRILAKDIKQVFEQAKQMEKEQMKDAFTDPNYYTPFDSHVAFEEYYKEVYGKK